MNLLKSTGFLIKSLYLRPFHCPNVRVDFYIFSNLLISFHAFTGNFGKDVGKIGAFTNEIVTQKEHTVKSTLAKRKASGFSRRQNLCRHSLFDQAIFDFDAVQLFQHGFGGDENTANRIMYRILTEWPSFMRFFRM